MRNPRNILNEEIKMTVSKDFVATIKDLISKEHTKEINMVAYQYEKLAGLLDDWQTGIELDRELGVFRSESNR